MVEFLQGLESTSVSFFLVFEHLSHEISLIQCWQNIGSIASHYCVLHIGLVLISLDQTIWVSYWSSCQYNEGSALTTENNKSKTSLYLCMVLIYSYRFLCMRACVKCLNCNHRVCPVPFYTFCFPNTKTMFAGCGGLIENQEKKVSLKWISDQWICHFTSTFCWR